MDQVKIGKFIAERRKEKNMTQAELAEKLNITDRAISKWETGKGMPDSSIMLDLCNELNISVNELLSGEMIKMENYDRKAEENFIKLQKDKEDSDKRLLFIETIIGSIITISFLLIIFVSIFAIENIIWKITAMIVGIMIFIIGIGSCLRRKLFMRILDSELKNKTINYDELLKYGFIQVPIYLRVNKQGK